MRSGSRSVVDRASRAGGVVALGAGMALSVNALPAAASQVRAARVAGAVAEPATARTSQRPSTGRALEARTPKAAETVHRPAAVAPSTPMPASSPVRRAKINTRLTGSITGIVTGLGKPLSGICVDTSVGPRSSTSSNGSYTISGLAPGSYYVMFATGCGSGSQNWASQWWKDAPNESMATPVPVKAGKTTSGIDAAVQVGGILTGVAKSAAGAKLSGVCIEGSAVNGSTTFSGISTSSGAYTVEGIAAGKYTVEFSAECGSASTDWIPQYWKYQSQNSFATPVPVAAGTTTSGIDAALEPGGIVTGKVTDSAHAGISGMCVEVYGPSGYGFASTALSGAYAVTGLPSGSYTVHFTTGCGSASDNWLNQDWKNQPGDGRPTPLGVKEGQTDSGIDAVLLVGGIITGTVKTNTGALLAGICVEAVPLSTGSAGASSVPTAGNGTYSVEGLTTGAYYVEFYAGCGSTSDNWLSQYWIRSLTQDLSTAVSVTQGKSTGAVSPTMEPGGTITGTVTDAAKSGIGGICISAEPANNAATGTETATTTSSNGTFELGGLPTGTYSVSYDAGCGATGNWLQQWRNSSDNLATAASVAVKAGKTTPGIDATLQPGGQVTGTVTGPGGAVVGNICVNVETLSGTYQGSTETSPSGTYTVSGLPTGTFNVQFSGCGENYAPVWYGGTDAQSTAKAVHVMAGKTTALASTSVATGGLITGSVALAGQHDGAGVCVDATSVASGSYVGYGSTSFDGSFDISGLATGKYVLELDTYCGAADSVSQYYGGTSPKTAKEVAVTAGKTTAGVTATLLAGGSISGVVKSASGPLANVCAAVSATGEYGATGLTSSTGTYSIGDLPAGKYEVSFSYCGGTSGTQYATQWWKGQSTSLKPTLVSVVDGKNRSGIDATMTKAGSISGTVDRPGGVGEGLVCVFAFAVTPGLNGGYATTSAGGAYNLYDMSPGKYDVEVDAGCAGSTFGTEWYKGGAVQSSAAAVAVYTGKNTSGINSTLLYAGEISGTVKAGGSPIAGVCVYAYYPGSSIEAGFDTSAVAGQYELTGLEPGHYDVFFDALCVKLASGSSINYTSQWWKGASSQPSAKELTVKSQKDTTGIDADLSGGGTIEGTVKSAGGSALVSIPIEAFIAGTSYVASYTMTGASGNYSLTGLPSGSYDVLFNPSSGCGGGGIFGSFYWRNAVSEAGATDVKVTAGKVTTGISASLGLSTTPFNSPTSSGAGGTTNAPRVVGVHPDC
jgi:hypothetical protein